jgi:GTP-binding protein
MRTAVIVGRPNVGKSSLFNVLTKTKNALVADIPGLTRDRHYAKIKINNSFFNIVDTGGLEPNKNSEINKKMSEQSQWAIDESDVILFIVDGREGLTRDDEIIANELRKKNKPTLLIINKSEGKSDNYLISEFASLGQKNIICISVSHKEGISLIYDFLQPFSDNSEDIEIFDEEIIKLSILGKPNVGKSTLINSIIGEERLISQDEPGTTRDSITVDFEINGKKFKLTDTAGIRKKGKVTDVIEKFSILKSLLNIDRADVCILVIDALSGLSSQDLQIFGYVIESGKPLVIAINKWDALDSYEKDILKNEIDKKIGLLINFEIIHISALKKIGIKKLLEFSLKAFGSSKTKMSTPVLNSLLKELVISHQPPISKGIRPKLKFAHQGDSVPPTIIIHGNHLSGLRQDYIKYLESSFIKFFNLRGTNLRIQLNEANNPFEKNGIKVKKTGLVTRRRQINKKREEIKKKNKV